MFDHVGLNVRDYVASRAFYEQFLGGRASAPYRNERTGFESYFVKFDGGPRLELMRMPEIAPRPGDGGRPVPGFVHIAFSLGTEAAVDAFHAAALAAGGIDNGGPGVREHYHPTYYGAFVHDLDGNNVEAVCHASG